VMGVNSQIATAGNSQGNVGIGFAVPSNTVREVSPAPREGRQDRAPLPRRGDLRSDRSPTRRAGAEVTTVTPGGPAEGAGVNAGDVHHRARRPARERLRPTSRGSSTTKKPGDTSHPHRPLRPGRDARRDAAEPPAHTP
jgi:putative serine protease PepD